MKRPGSPQYWRERGGDSSLPWNTQGHPSTDARERERERERESVYVSAPQRACTSTRRLIKPYVGIKDAHTHHLTGENVPVTKLKWRPEGSTGKKERKKKFQNLMKKRNIRTLSLQSLLFWADTAQLTSSGNSDCIWRTTKLPVFQIMRNGSRIGFWHLWVIAGGYHLYEWNIKRVKKERKNKTNLPLQLVLLAKHAFSCKFWKIKKKKKEPV